MSEHILKQFQYPGGGGELTIAAMDKYSRLEIGRKTYRFAREVMRDPELRAKVKARAAEIRAQQQTGKGYCAPERNRERRRQPHE